MTEGFANEPQTPEEWEREVYLTKVRDRLVLLRNRDIKRFQNALVLVTESPEFISYGAQLEDFVARKGPEAQKFVATLGADIEQVTFNGDVSLEQFM